MEQPNDLLACPFCGALQDNRGKQLVSTDWLDAAEIRTALISTLPYYEAEDKDRYLYVARHEDITAAVNQILAAGRAKASNGAICSAEEAKR